MVDAVLRAGFIRRGLSVLLAVGVALGPAVLRAFAAVVDFVLGASVIEVVGARIERGPFVDGRCEARLLDDGADEGVDWLEAATVVAPASAGNDVPVRREVHEGLDDRAELVNAWLQPHNRALERRSVERVPQLGLHQLRPGGSGSRRRRRGARANRAPLSVGRGRRRRDAGASAPTLHIIAEGEVRLRIAKALRLQNATESSPDTVVLGAVVQVILDLILVDRRRHVGRLKSLGPRRHRWRLERIAPQAERPCPQPRTQRPLFARRWRPRQQAVLVQARFGIRPSKESFLDLSELLGQTLRET
mmetsp:Transcript_99857/g.286864  ORF Transcript_99857/g.286864 Transcript_99857/m.286864 type:complete len:304 (-) Transcript_99857:740-1651(-)